MSIFQFLKSKSFFKQIAFGIIGLVIIIFSLKFWLGVTTNHDQKIQVPELHKLTISAAEKTLKELDLDFKVIDSASYNTSYPKKSVIEQSPEAGDFVKGRTKRQAISELQAIGFIVGTEFTYVKDIGKDVVRGLRHNGKIVNPNDQLPKNSIIELVLGDGKRN